MSKIIRGTTPTITFQITSDTDLTKLTEIWFTLSDSRTGEERTFYLSEGEIAVDNEHKTLTIQLTQEDTLKFKSDVLVQIRALDEDGLAYATAILNVSLDDILKGGVITDA